MQTDIRDGCFCCSRRHFLEMGALTLASTALHRVTAADLPVKSFNSKVAIAACTGYGPEVKAALEKNFDLLGGIGGLVKDKTVTVKINLTGSDFKGMLGKTAGETFITHSATVMALTSVFFNAGAKRVRLVESTNLRQPLEKTLLQAGYDLSTLMSMGKVELEDTRNLGTSKDYATLKVPGGGIMFGSFDLNRAYADTDVFVSLCKLKTHVTTGVTLTMKNLFGITPNALYGDESPSENAVNGRGRMHDLVGWEERKNPDPYDPPGAKESFFEKKDGGYRVPRIITDLCCARPIHLGIIDGITTITYAEGPWVNDKPQAFINPGVLICGLNPVATDTVGTAVMGFDNVRATRGTLPFRPGDNHLLLAEQCGLGVADMSKIEVLGVPIEKVRCRKFII